MKKIIFLFASLLGFSCTGQDLKYYDGQGNGINKPAGLSQLKENLYQDTQSNVYFQAPYVKHLSNKDDDIIVPTVLGIMLQQYFYDSENDNFIPLVKTIDVKTYQIVDAFIYKDKKYVYLYRGSENIHNPFLIMKELSPDDLNVFKGNYLVSNNKAYYYGGIQYALEVKNADAATFMVFSLKDSSGDNDFYFAKDKNHCYFRGEQLNKDDFSMITKMVSSDILSICGLKY